MSVFPLLLPGWDDQSVWGDDGDYLFAQVTRNGASDADGPEFWIMPPQYPIARTVEQLGTLIAQVTRADVNAVITAMTAGVALHAEATRPPAPPAASPAPPRQLDLADNAPGVGLSQEAARRRRIADDGADRSWWAGETGEIRIAEVIEPLVTPSRWQRLRHQPAAWRVLHSVAIHNALGQQRGDIDHVLIGPPGVLTINTKHHHAGRVEVDGDAITVNGRQVDYIRRARLEALQARELLQTALARTAEQSLPAEQLPVRPLIAIVGARLLVRQAPVGVLVRMPRELVHTVRQLPAAVDSEVVEQVYAVARQVATWRRGH